MVSNIHRRTNTRVPRPSVRTLTNVRRVQVVQAGRRSQQEQLVRGNQALTHVRLSDRVRRVRRGQADSDFREVGVVLRKHGSEQRKLHNDSHPNSRWSMLFKTQKREKDENKRAPRRENSRLRLRIPDSGKHPGKSHFAFASSGPLILHVFATLFSLMSDLWSNSFFPKHPHSVAVGRSITLMLGFMLVLSPLKAYGEWIWIFCIPFRFV